MAEKRFYWLKLKRDFFKRHDIRIIEEMPNGKDYILFYLKLLLESIDHEGSLRFSDTIPYNEQMLSVITNTNVDIVHRAMEIFVELHMIDVLEDSTIYMLETEKMLGSESASAGKMRALRERQRKSQCDLPVIKSDTEKEIDIDIDSDTEKKKQIDYQQIKDLYNEICISFPRLTVLSENRKKAIRARLNTYSIDDFRTVFEAAEASSFMKGKNDRNWQATFDWMMKDSNFVKILEGNYAERVTRRNGPKNTESKPKGDPLMDDLMALHESCWMNETD